MDTHPFIILGSYTRFPKKDKPSVLNQIVVETKTTAYSLFIYHERVLVPVVLVTLSSIEGDRGRQRDGGSGGREWDIIEAYIEREKEEREREGGRDTQKEPRVGFIPEL